MLARIGMALFGAAMAAGAAAQTAAPTATTLTVVAEGRSERAPDIAEVSGGVVTSAATADAAMRQNAEKMAAVVAAVRAAGIAERDIQTASLNLEAQYRYADNQPPTLVGYQVRNSVALRLRRPGDAGRLLDTLVRMGANQVSGPVFRVEDSAGALDAARAAAVATGTARARLYATAAGLRVRRIVSIAESVGDEGRPPMQFEARMTAEQASTPVIPGQVALAVSVTMVFELE